MRIVVRGIGAVLRSLSRWTAVILAWIVLIGIAGLLLRLFGRAWATAVYEYPGWVQVIGGGSIVGALLFVSVRRRMCRQALRRFAAGAGWHRVDPAGRDWPWTERLHQGDEVRARASGRIRVRSAWKFRSGGFPVTAGEIKGSRSLLDGTVEKDSGQIVFVLVDLTEPAGSAAMRKPFEFIGERSRESSTLNVAFLNGEIPPWTVRDDELFTFQRPTCGTHPDGIREAVRRTLRVAELLGHRAAP